MSAKKGKQAEAVVRVEGRPFGASDLWGSVDFALKRHPSPHGQVTAVSMMKDEGAYVIEWVAHHLAIGFSDLLVYTNDCSDGTDDMLIRLEELGLCHHRRNVIAEGIRPQPSALGYAQDEPVVQNSDWVMVFDADEFLSIKYGDGTLDDLIAAAVAQGANGIVVTWRIFGSGGVVDWSRAPVSEQYLWAAPQTWNKGWGVKTLFKFSADKWKLGIHRPKMKAKWVETEFPDQVKWLNGSGREMEDYFKFRGWRSITRTVGYDWVQLNHYAVKSVDSYAIRKMRGNVNNKADKYNSDYWSLQDRNEVRDETMLRYSEKRNQIIARLLQDPVLHSLHYAALARAEARLQELRQTDAGLRQHLHGRGDQVVGCLSTPGQRARIGATVRGHADRQNFGAGVKGQPVSTHAAAPLAGAGCDARTPKRMPPVTIASPTSRFQYMGSPSTATAPSADRPGTKAVIMVDRTGPKCLTIWVKVMPEITTDPPP